MRPGCRAAAAPGCCSPTSICAKSFGKEALAPEGAGPFFLLAPVVSFACYLTVPLLIPVLTSYALPLGYMGDILGGGFILALASFLVAVAAAETGDVYAQLGSSRSKTFAAITEPVVLLVVFTVALVTTTDLPYVLGATMRSGPDQIVRPAHLLASAALFMVILFETGRIPVETHTGTIEFGMIEEARPFEHSGPYYALLRWGSAAKQLVLYTILLNVFIAPWGMASTTALDRGRVGDRVRCWPRRCWWAVSSRSSTPRSPSCGCSRSPSSSRRRSCWRCWRSSPCCWAVADERSAGHARGGRPAAADGVRGHRQHRRGRRAAAGVR